jgi:hypothetical protein
MKSSTNNKVIYLAKIVVFFLIACSPGKNEVKNNESEKLFKSVEINHFLIFKFNSSVGDVIRLLKTKEISFKEPITLKENEVSYKYMQVLNYPLEGKVLDSVDLYFYHDSLYLIKHEKSFKEVDCYCDASLYNSSINDIFSGLYEKYGGPTHARNFTTQSSKTGDGELNSIDTVAANIKKNSWIDWNYLDPVQRLMSSSNKLEIMWGSKIGTIVVMKEFNISYEPFFEKIDRSKMPDFMPPKSKEYENGKTYKFYHKIQESNFIIYAYSPKKNDFLNR